MPAITDPKSSSKSGTVVYPPTAGSGFTDTAVQTKSGVNKLFPDGVVRKAFCVKMTWEKGRNTLKNTYVKQDDGTKTFDTGYSYFARVTYGGVKALDKIPDPRKTFQYFAEMTVNLNKGGPLTTKSKVEAGEGDAQPAPEKPAENTGDKPADSGAEATAQPEQPAGKPAENPAEQPVSENESGAESEAPAKPAEGAEGNTAPVEEAAPEPVGAGN